MKVKLREKKISGGRKSLYLDFYPPIVKPDTGGATRREFLGLYTFDRPRNDPEKQHNKETKSLAESVRAKRQIELDAGEYGFLNKSKKGIAQNGPLASQKCHDSLRGHTPPYTIQV